METNAGLCKCSSLTYLRSSFRRRWVYRNIGGSLMGFKCFIDSLEIRTVKASAP